MNNESDSTVTEELLYVYPAMGLKHQHESQQMLLAYANTPTMIVNLIAAARAKLEVGVYEDSISYPRDFPT